MRRYKLPDKFVCFVHRPSSSQKSPVMTDLEAMAKR